MHVHALPLPCRVQDKEKSLSDQRRYSLIDPSSSSAPEVLRLQHQLMSTEDALRNALDQAQQVERLVEAMRSCPDKPQVSCVSPRSAGRDPALPPGVSAEGVHGFILRSSDQRQRCGFAQRA